MSGPASPTVAVALAAWLLAGSAAAAPANCVDGVAAGHACHRVDLLARLDVAALGAGNLNDVWGWTDPVGGREYALVGAVDGTVFVDIGDPTAPRIVGRLPAHEFLAGAHPASASAACKAGAGGAAGGAQPQHEDCGAGGSSTWRNIKVHRDHAYVGSESAGHGVQVFDLTQLRAFPAGSPVQTFAETAHYGGFGHSHTLDIDEVSGYLYGVGSDTYAGGPHFVDLADPVAPVGVGGYAGDGYSHEILCRVYAGPDAAHAGRQICFGSNEDTLTVLDVTNKALPVQLSRTGYPSVGYTHQGWLSADQRWLWVNDELDESMTGERTRTLVWDLADLEAPVLAAEILQPRYVIDHNNYVRDGFVFQSNYTAGLVILDGREPVASHEVAFFDTHPAGDSRVFDGTWSNYPFFASGVVAISDITRGLYLVRPQLGGASVDASVTLVPDGGPAVGEPGGQVVPGAAGGTFTVSVGPQARIAAFFTDGGDPTCTGVDARVIRCRLDDATPFSWSATVVADGDNPVFTKVVAMVASGGVENAPLDNLATLTVQAEPTQGGGGGATDALALLALLLAAGRAARRPRGS